MGSFFGHVLPGLFFIVAAIYWAIQTIRSFYKSLQKSSFGKSPPFYSTPTFIVQIKGKRVKIECYIVIIFSAIGLFVELVCATIKNHHLGIGNIQHGTMYFFFGMTSLLAVVLPRLKVIPCCDDIVYLMIFLSFVVEGLLFKFHLFGRDDFDVVLHTLLVYTIFACAAVTLLEVTHRNSIWPPLARAFFTCLQGTWFCQVAFFLYPPLTNPWGGYHEAEQQSRDTHSPLMFATCVYAWHMAVITILMIICSLSIGCFYRKKGWIDEEALQEQHYVLRQEIMGYSSLQQNSSDQDDAI